ncbi:MAG TPA: YdeI/OmpD-associated family protein [Chitinophagales bacterium]|nr:YdeI/OmpD-associated family protein [Chitinophagales bacterium]
MKEYNFTATMQDAGGGGVFVFFPYDVKKEFGKPRVPIRCTIDGEAYRGTMVKYGHPQHMLLVLKAIREKIGKGPGDKVKVWLVEDLEERTIEIPLPLAAMLKKNKLEAAFNAKSFTQRKEWIVGLNDAKREETRVKRINAIIETLKNYN